MGQQDFWNGVCESQRTSVGPIPTILFMSKRWNSIEELKAMNKIRAVFEKYRIEPSLYPQLGGGDYFLMQAELIPDLIGELANLYAKEKPLWNFGKFPGEE